MTYEDALTYVQQITRREKLGGFVHVRPGSSEFNFRFIQPIEAVDPTGSEVTVCHVKPDGHTDQLVNSEEIGRLTKLVTRNNEYLRRTQPAYGEFLKARGL